MNLAFHVNLAKLCFVVKIVKNYTMQSNWLAYDSLASTNLKISEILKEQNPGEGLVVMADYQEAGKGQGTHAWHSRKGENLLMSLLLKPAFLSASAQFHISRIVSVALCEVLESRGVSPQIKWPNDILVSGGKMAGILIEHGISGGNISHTIAGVGLNLNQREFPGFPTPATSLVLETGRKSKPGEVAEELVEKILFRYQELKAGDEEALLKEYRDRLYLRDARSRFEAGGVEFEGIIRGVDPFGQLLVESEGELRAYGHGQVSFRPHGSSQ